VAGTLGGVGVGARAGEGLVVLPWSRTGPGLCFQHVVVDVTLPNPFGDDY